MLHSLINWSLKTLGQLILWVFILSIEWQGQSLYERAYGIVIDNSFVHNIQSEVGKFWTYTKEKVIYAVSSDPIVQRSQSSY